MANVLFTRKNASEIPNVPITDGQLIFDTSGNGKMYLDNGTNRLEMGGALTVDATLSKTSTNPVQNKAVAGVMLDTLSDIGNVTSKGFLTDALAVKELNTNVNELNNSLIANSKHFYFDYKNGKYGYNTNPNRGADTFVPFSNIKYQYKDVTGLQLGAFVSKKITYDFSDICEQILGVCGCGFPTESLEPFTFVFPSEIYPNIISINGATVTISLRRVYGTDMGAPVNYRIWFACI